MKKAKQTTLHNTPYIKRDGNNVFIDTRTNKPFDFSSLHDEKNRTYDGLSYKDYILYSICRHTDGDKMEKILSISGTPFNEYCNKKTQNDCFVCSHCYSRKQLKRYIDLHFKCEKNEYFYSHIELAENDIPFIPSTECRYESFGEITTILKVKNYCLIAEKNKHCYFTFFTKMPFIMHNAFTKYGYIKPKNSKVLLSSPCLDTIAIIPNIYKYFVDGTFTVFTKQHVIDFKISINCEKKCHKCLKCYRDNNITQIFELLK